MKKAVRTRTKIRTTRKPGVFIQLKFRDDIAVSIVRGRPTLRKARGKGSVSKHLRALIAATNARWERLHQSGDAKIARLIARACNRNPKKPIPNLLNYCIAELYDEESAGAFVTGMRQMKEIDYIDWMPRAYPPPVVPDLTSPTNGTGFFQGYLRPFNPALGLTGIGADVVPGRGGGIKICDVEYNCNFDHFTFDDRITVLGGNPVNPAFLDADDVTSHGTSVIGIYGGRAPKREGSEGIARDAQLYFSPVITGLWPNIGDAITRAAIALGEGDIIVVEQQIGGPNYNVFADTQDGLVCVEWDKATYDAVVVAVDAGLIVVEAAGNGRDDFDSERFHRDGINRHHNPFRRENDSGAIIVGAGDSTTQTKLGFSNFGVRVDLQGWGNNVVTSSGPTVRSNLFSADGVDKEYTRSFGGTSAATPIVAGAAALAQQAFKARYRRPATCRELRHILIETGHPQQPGANGALPHIGPLPDAKLAVDRIQGRINPPVFVPDGRGTYTAGQTVVIGFGAGTSTANAEIRFTRDGSEPTPTSPRFRLGITRIRIDRSTIVKARTFMTDPIDSSTISSPTASANFQVVDGSLPPPTLFDDGLDTRSNKHLIKADVPAGFTLGQNALLWYNINQTVDPVPFDTGTNASLYMGSIKLAPGRSYTIRARWCTFDPDGALVPGPVARVVFNL